MRFKDRIAKYDSGNPKGFDKETEKRAATILNCGRMSCAPMEEITVARCDSVLCEEGVRREA